MTVRPQLREGRGDDAAEQPQGTVGGSGNTRQLIRSYSAVEGFTGPNAHNHSTAQTSISPQQHHNLEKITLYSGYSEYSS
jgi:hypothetical protein